MSHESAAKLYISEDLEQSLVAGLVRGIIGLDAVPVKALSKDGQAVAAGVEFLEGIGKKPPHAKNSVLNAACDVAGAERAAMRPYIDKALAVGGGDEATAIVEKLNQQLALSEISNEAARQLAARTFDPRAFAPHLAIKRKAGLVPACDLLVDDKLPPIPVGYEIKSLPTLSEASGGVMGVWAVGGKAKMGKSTLGVQIALEVPVPVVYYDMENGESVLLYRIGKAFGGDVSKLKARTRQFYMRRNIQTLAQDLAAVPAPALIVVDSLQKLPTKQDQRRTGIDGWLAKFERLKEDGYSVLLISEVNGFGGYKETSEIEYTVDFGMQLRRDDSGVVTAHVVANRHRPQTGDICELERVNDWWFKESDDLGHNQAQELGL